MNFMGVCLVHSVGHLVIPSLLLYLIFPSQICTIHVVSNKLTYCQFDFDSGYSSCEEFRWFHCDLGRK